MRTLMKITQDDIIFSPLQTQILDVLQKKGPMTRNALVDEIKSPRTTVYDNLTGLMQYNLVKRYSHPMNARGRPQVFFKVLDIHSQAEAVIS